jgi:asparagine synthase (glutamine-hydrolysing)
MLKTIGVEIAKTFISTKKVNFLKLARDNKDFFWGGAHIFDEYEKEKLFNTKNEYDTYSNFIEPFYQQYDSMNPNSSFIDRSIALDMHHRLPELLLMRTDKMAMATSVETRVPFLDHKLVEFALSIPSNMKINKGVEKYILKESARGIIPDKIIDKPKMGFCGSASSMLSTEFLNYAENEINNSVWMRERFNIENINQIIKLQKDRSADNGMEIYSLINLCLWHRNWFDS